MFCPSTLKGITANCDTNIGGLATKVYIANKCDVKTITKDPAGETVETIVMENGKHFYEFDFKKNSADCTTEWTIDEASGVRYATTSLNLSFARQETTKRVAVEALVLGELIVVFKDCNGYQQILGADEEVPVTCSSASSNSGKAKTDSNQYLITLSEESSHFPLECTQDMKSLLENAPLP